MASHRNGRKDGAIVDGGHIHIASAAAPDWRQYRAHLTHMGLPPEREEEIILSVQRIMTSFVDRAWEDDPVQLLGLTMTSSEDNASGRHNKMVGLALRQDHTQTAVLSDAFQPNAARKRKKEDS
jgi:hypothetical protein